MVQIAAFFRLIERANQLNGARTYQPHDVAADKGGLSLTALPCSLSEGAHGRTAVGPVRPSLQKLRPGQSTHSLHVLQNGDSCVAVC